MRTPAGFECPYFYGDYYRGRDLEECRLLENHGPENQWSADLCKTCPVPGIVRANACPNLVLDGHVERGLFKLGKRRVKVTAACKKTLRNVERPEIGCGECHPLPPSFEEKSR